MVPKNRATQARDRPGDIRVLWVTLGTDPWARNRSGAGRVLWGRIRVPNGWAL